MTYHIIRHRKHGFFTHADPSWPNTPHYNWDESFARPFPFFGAALFVMRHWSRSRRRNCGIYSREGPYIAPPPSPPPPPEPLHISPDWSKPPTQSD
jgi:hypothetical protein